MFPDHDNRTVTPGSLIKGARNEDHPWQYSITALRGWKGSGRTWNSDPQYINLVWTEISGALNGPVDWPLPPIETSDLYNQALERLNAKARGTLDLSVSLAEGGQTKKMFSSVAKTLNHALHWRNYVKKRFAPKNLREWVRDGSAGAANGWLQWTYGWKPLLGDVFQSLDERQRIVFNKVEKLKGRASFNREVDFEKYIGIEPVTSPGSLVSVSGVNKQAVTICVKISTRDGTDISRWSSLNPISIAYELTPYSFVVDWFFDVGSYLRNLETGLLYGSRFMGGYVSTLVVQKTDGTAAGRAVDGALLRSATAWKDRITFNRDMLTSYPLPQRPSFKADLGSGRMLSAAALLRQLL